MRVRNVHAIETRQQGTAGAQGTAGGNSQSILQTARADETRYGYDDTLGDEGANESMSQ